MTDKYQGFFIANYQLDRDPQAAAARAGIDQCRAGNTAVGISLLETSLRNVGLDLPPRPNQKYITVSHGHFKGG